MTMDYDDIKAAIPHRPPFLLVDEIVEMRPDRIVAKTTLRPDDDLWSRIYAGHYPGSPITPGALLLEMLFQAAGVLMAGLVRDDAPVDGVPVVTRVNNAKFKRMILPGDTVELRVRITDTIGAAYCLKGEAVKGGKVAAQAEFALTIAPAPGDDANSG
ncbi:MAG: beta-hydroxyacyl-ACP dehydratase [Planctomycetota bacterium]|jgi:3-hydroxyacyl-[acyl-carrier-protein] dehydratase|nr:beta-hydroxyacyl-ACP dehydratase [Planctomycetota bacterium]